MARVSSLARKILKTHAQAGRRAENSSLCSVQSKTGEGKLNRRQMLEQTLTLHFPEPAKFTLRDGFMEEMNLRDQGRPHSFLWGLRAWVRAPYGPAFSPFLRLLTGRIGRKWALDQPSIEGPGS